MSRAGQIWEGPITGSKPQIHLVIRRSEDDREVEGHTTLNLSTGLKSKLLMLRIDEDENWRRIA